MSRWGRGLLGVFAATALQAQAAVPGPLVDAYFDGEAPLICFAQDVAVRLGAPSVLSFTCMDSQERHGCRQVGSAQYAPESRYLLVNCERVPADPPIPPGGWDIFMNGFG